ncbi:NADH-quinone oxidoreductase subunit F [Tritrichomonas foetus]|uniref:NADH-quinone oxidoreductase subunit F n=1 Tax=Tritrichomonas foetus TaxID=1144522 RepID=A0A1J4JC04_9EUKA|nr:NADH-quinone oxidoreductase subunit F [Tritrichomonas foetus]|eukprot:OHS95187.1 NADH-quinone oxidoreductase subunit F [Tritrichomonas foetus]
MTRGDWGETEKFIKQGREWILDQVKTSEIRGRGGAGFATGTKWSFIPKDTKNPHYLVINADEGEPGTCKDRQILTNEPHKLVEGALLAAYTIQAHSCYVYVRGEFRHEIRCLQKAIDEAYAAGLIGKNNKYGWDFDMYIHSGAGAYVCGEETALLNSIEGLPGRPRFKPPYPAVKGLFGCPTVINNVETISSVSTICRRGGKWFSSIGVPNSRGPKIFSISGCVNNPCVVEESMGIPLRELIEKHAGGVTGGWDNLLAIIPGGLSCPILNPKESSEAIMSYDDLASYGSALGTGAVIVMDKNVDILKAFARLTAFYHHESCGQCGPCRQGTAKLAEILDRIAAGKGTKADLCLLEETAQATNNCVCALAGASSDPIRGLLKNFRSEIMSRLKE